jgi:hypothetical protein
MGAESKGGNGPPFSVLVAEEAGSIGTACAMEPSAPRLRDRNFS